MCACVCVHEGAHARTCVHVSVTSPKEYASSVLILQIADAAL